MEVDAQKGAYAAVWSYFVLQALWSIYISLVWLDAERLRFLCKKRCFQQTRRRKI
jgi:hypothetical protein